MLNAISAIIIIIIGTVIISCDHTLFCPSSTGDYR